MNEKLERFWDWLVYEGDSFIFMIILSILLFIIIPWGIICVL